MTSRSLHRASFVLMAALVACSGGGGKKSEGPPVTGTVAERLAAGMTALEQGLATQGTDALLLAANELAAAASLVGWDKAASQADLDRARAFGGLARLALLAQPYSDQAPGDGLHDLGDLLDAFGMGGTTFQRSHLDTIEFMHCTTMQPSPYYSYEQCELRTLPANSPRSGDLQAFLAGELRTALTGAVALLDAVTPGLQATVHASGRTVEVDHADVLLASALAHAALAQIDIQQAYDLDVDLDELQANLKVETYRPTDFLAEYPSFLKLESAATLPTAREHALAGIRAARKALDALQAETDDQADDLIRLSSQVCTYGPAPWDPNLFAYTCQPVFNSAEQIAEARAALDDAEAFLAAGSYAFGRDTPETEDDFTVAPGRFFEGLDLRALIPASFTKGVDGDRPGLFPDPTFGGLLVASPYDLNADLDADGSPDLFGYTQFFDGFLGAGPFFTSGWTSGGSWNGECTFLPGTHTFSWSRSIWISGTPAPVTTVYTGTYAIDRNVLTLTFTSPGPDGVRTEEIVASDFSDTRFAVRTLTYRDASGAILPIPWEWWYR